MAGKNHASNPKTYTIESQIKLKNPTRSGYHFVGWYKDSKYKTKISTIKKGSKGSLTLYARWTPQVSPSSKAAALTSVKGLRAKTIVATATVPKYVRSYDSYYYLVYVNSNTGKVKRAAAKITKPQTSNRKITLKVNISKNPEYAQGKFCHCSQKDKNGLGTDQRQELCQQSGKTGLQPESMILYQRQRKVFSPPICMR